MQLNLMSRKDKVLWKVSFAMVPVIQEHCENHWSVPQLPQHRDDNQRCWLTGEAPEDWGLVKVVPTCKMGRKEDLENYKPVNPVLVSEKVMDDN